MDFDRKKLSREEGAQLRPLQPNTMQPYALLPAPVYVFLRRNEKYVSVKGPLDFFSDEELERYSSAGTLFFPDFIDSVLPFQSAAVRVRSVLSIQPRDRQGSGTGKIFNVPMALSSYEVSDAVLRLVGPLWGRSISLEPFFSVIFVDELCEAIPATRLIAARELNVEAFEHAILSSSLLIFLALHLGWCDLPYLNDLRVRSFDAVMEGVTQFHGRVSEEVELFSICRDAAFVEKTRSLTRDWLALRAEIVGQKLAFRLGRVLRDLAEKSQPTSSVYGKGGLIDG